MRFLHFFLESVKDKRQELYNQFVTDYYSPGSLNVRNEERINTLVNQILDADISTRFGKTDYANQIYQWMTNESIKFPEDFQKTKELIRDYHKLKQQLPALKQTNISQFRTFGDLYNTVQNAKNKTAKMNKQESFELISSEGEYKLFLIKEKDKAAFCKLTQSTGWCVKDPNYFDHYKPPFYLVTKGNQLYALMHPESDQLKSVNDSPFYDVQELFPLKNFINKVFRVVTPENQQMTEDDLVELKHRASDMFKHEDLKLVVLLFPELLKAIEFDGTYAYSFLNSLVNLKAEIHNVATIQMLNERIHDLEHVIANYSDLATNYVLHMTLSEFPEAEDAIARDPRNSRAYAITINRRFPKGEKMIATSAEDAYLYAKEILKGRFPEAESAIAKNADIAVRYATYILKRRFPEAEQTIINSEQNLSHVHAYIRSVLSSKHERSPLVEQYIIDNNYYDLAYLYFKYVIDRDDLKQVVSTDKNLQKLEDVIITDPDQTVDYATILLKDKFPKGEEAISKSENKYRYEEMLYHQKRYNDMMDSQKKPSV